jgi:hypothetical protein
MGGHMTAIGEAFKITIGAVASTGNTSRFNILASPLKEISSMKSPETISAPAPLVT